MSKNVKMCSTQKDQNIFNVVHIHAYKYTYDTIIYIIYYFTFTFIYPSFQRVRRAVYVYKESP